MLCCSLSIGPFQQPIRFINARLGFSPHIFKINFGELSTMVSRNSWIVETISPPNSSLKEEECSSNPLINSSKKLKKKTPKSKSKKLSSSTDLLPFDNLDWKQVSNTDDSLVFDHPDGAFVMLEEIDDVQITKEEGPHGTIIKFQKVQPSKDKAVKPTENNSQPAKNKKRKKSKEKQVSFKENPEILEPSAEGTQPLPDLTPKDFSAWEEFNFQPTILEGIKSLGFENPTPIQKSTLQVALHCEKDVIGAAETGSGKTLAFGLPILNYIVQNPQSFENKHLRALILTPTRELAIQVKDQLCGVASNSNITVAAVVGGMSVEKQERILQKKPDVVVATPGRLWALRKEGNKYLLQLEGINFLVIDEADRMLENGHFKELDLILAAVSKKNKRRKSLNNENTDSEPTVIHAHQHRQTFVFSATITNNKLLKSQKHKRITEAGTLDHLLEKIEYNSSGPEVLDMTTKGLVASKIFEGKIDCLLSNKDLYLYYILLKYPGKTLVFVNSVDSLRRLVPILQLLGLNAWPLHAQMQQRQRLKNLERFKSNNNCILVATDVAARGLDISAVNHVVHYQLARTADTYIHRCGRTARANNEGVSVILCGPNELSSCSHLCKLLGKVEFPDFPVDRNILNSLKKRIDICLKIDQVEHSNRKKSKEAEWFSKQAKELDMDLDENLVCQKNSVSPKLLQLKAQLKDLLRQPIIPKGVSQKYITSGVIRNLPSNVLNKGGLTGGMIVGSETTSAIEDIRSKTSQRKKRKIAQSLTIV